MHTTKGFLTAEWRHILMVNYAVDPELLRERVPRGTELDAWNGTVYVSLVGMTFLHTRVKGKAIPFHSNFEEINLRFYVRRKEGKEWKRGVVFVKEIVPKPLIALVARLFYNEKYIALPTRHLIQQNRDIYVRYEWRFNGHWNFMEAMGKDDPQPLAEGSEEQFISEHYWGYSVQRNGETKEYQVEHYSWRIWQCPGATIDVNTALLYGPEFEDALARQPTSVFIAAGSEVTVLEGRTIRQ